VSDLIVTLPPEAWDAIAGRVAELLADQSPWMTREEAAAYMHLPASRLEKDKTVPCHQDRPGGRVLYHRGELDAHFLALCDDAGNGNAPAGGLDPRGTATGGKS
jgi:hypothetical protein